jgi:hypothetical protein
VKERDAAGAAIDAEVFAGVVPPPMQTQIQRMGGMRSAVRAGSASTDSPVVHELELVAKFANMTAKETAKEHGWQLKEATAHQRHRIRQRLATVTWRDFHENKIARLPSPACVERGPQHRVRTHALPPAGVGRAVESRETPREKPRAQSHALGTQGVRGSAGGHSPFGGVAPPRPPQPRRGCGRAAGTPPQRERFAHGEGNVSASLTERAAAGRT